MSEYVRITDRKIEMTDEGVEALMSDYIPTTEEVREVYENRLIKISQNKYELIDVVQANAEFDRWLAEVKAQAWEEGRSDQYGEFPRIAKIDNPYRKET